ncbi:hypothetical protein TcasGA2_TC033593 [Tribolium castaneum]|uniref:Uncharacterized protein n=1 Tax=Tribolium castaneum TaxID=7070 RepID=A0A139WFN5_TRICA|nr:hypothetical protein TcasGA2_TC033593 [Tribolium castaneum]
MPRILRGSTTSPENVEFQPFFVRMKIDGGERIRRRFTNFLILYEMLEFSSCKYWRWIIAYRV